MTDPTARPCAIKRRIAFIVQEDGFHDRGPEETAERVADFLQRLNDRVSGWDGIILLGEVALLLRGYEEHHRARAERTKQAASQVMSAMDRADEDTASFEYRSAQEAEASLEKAERNARMAERLERFVQDSIDDLPSDGNPAEVLRALAVGLAARMGLQVDHEAFDDASRRCDEPVGTRDWRCVSCKAVTTAASIPDRCAACLGMQFALCAQSSDGANPHQGD